MSAPTPCRELTCTGLIAWLIGKVNVNTGKPANVPVDWDSLSTDEKEQYERGERFDFDKSKGHRPHYETCTKPQSFAKGSRSP